MPDSCCCPFPSFRALHAGNRSKYPARSVVVEELSISLEDVFTLARFDDADDKAW